MAFIPLTEDQWVFCLGLYKTLIEQGRLLEKVKEIAKKEVDPVFEKQIMEDMIKLY